MTARKSAVWISTILLLGVASAWLFVREAQPPVVQVATASFRHLETTFTADGIIRRNHARRRSGRCQNPVGTG